MCRIRNINLRFPSNQKKKNRETIIFSRCISNEKKWIFYFTIHLALGNITYLSKLLQIRNKTKILQGVNYIIILHANIKELFVIFKCLYAGIIDKILIIIIKQKKIDITGMIQEYKYQIKLVCRILTVELKGNKCILIVFEIHCSYSELKRDV